MHVIDFFQWGETHIYYSETQYEYIRNSEQCKHFRICWMLDTGSILIRDVF